MSVGYAGMDACDILMMPDDATEDEVQEEAYQMAVQHAESYGYYPRYEYDLSDEDEELDGDHYTDGIEGWAELYDPKKHDMKRSGGGSFADDFEE